MPIQHIKAVCNYCCSRRNSVEHVCLKVKTILKRPKLSLCSRIFLTLCRCSLVSSKLFHLNSLSRHATLLHTVWNVFFSWISNNVKILIAFMSRESWLKHVKTILQKQICCLWSLPKITEVNFAFKTFEFFYVSKKQNLST